MININTVSRIESRIKMN